MVWIYGLVMGFNLLLGLHFGLTTVFGWMKRKPKKACSEKMHRFAILIAARNEEKVIGYLLESLKKQDYPSDQYEVFVLPNHCTDQTEEVSRAHGAKILPISADVTSKGDVLNQAFSTLITKGFDAYAILDADNVVHPHFLTAMNQKLNEGYEVIQGFRDSKNASSNWLAGCYSIFYWIQNFFYQTRENRKSSSAISGTGFVIHSSYLRTFGYSMHTLTEDMELAAHCCLQNVKIGYASDAITYDEQPTSFAVSWRQRKRWTTGGYQCLRDYGIPLLKHVRQNPLACLDLFWVFFSPILQVITVVFLLLSPLLLHSQFHLSILLQSHFVGLLTGYFGLVFFAFFIVLLTNKKPFTLKKAIWLFPFFTVSWIPIQMLCLFRETKTWEPIEHKVSLEVAEVME